MTTYSIYRAETLGLLNEHCSGVVDEQLAVTNVKCGLGVTGVVSISVSIRDWRPIVRFLWSHFTRDRSVDFGHAARLRVCDRMQLKFLSLKNNTTMHKIIFLLQKIWRASGGLPRRSQIAILRVSTAGPTSNRKKPR